MYGLARNAHLVCQCGGIEFGTYAVGAQAQKCVELSKVLDSKLRAYVLFKIGLDVGRINKAWYVGTFVHCRVKTVVKQSVHI